MSVWSSGGPAKLHIRKNQNRSGEKRKTTIVEAESRQLGCIQVVDKVDVLCGSYATVQSSLHGDGVLWLVKFGSMDVRRRSDGKEACIPVEKYQKQ